MGPFAWQHLIVPEPSFRERTVTELVASGAVRLDCELGDIVDLESFHDRIAEVFRFEDYGRNSWALADWLWDLSWLEGDAKVIVFSGVRSLRRNCPVAAQTLEFAIEHAVAWGLDEVERGDSDHTHVFVTDD